MKVYWAWSTTAATPIPAAERRSRAKSLAEIHGGFDRLPRTRLGAMEVRGIGRHLWIVGTLGQWRFVVIVELIAKGKSAAEAFFDQITTAAQRSTRAGPARGGSGPGVPRLKPTSHEPTAVTGVYQEESPWTAGGLKLPRSGLQANVPIFSFQMCRQPTGRFGAPATLDKS